MDKSLLVLGGSALALGSFTFLCSFFFFTVFIFGWLMDGGNFFFSFPILCSCVCVCVYAS